MSEKATQLTDEQIATLAAERLQMRVQACGEEITAVLNKYRCDMQPVFEIRQGSMAGRIEIVPLPN